MTRCQKDIQARADALAQLVEQLWQKLALVGDELWEQRAALAQQGEPCPHAQDLKPRDSAQMRQMENEAAVRSFIQVSSGYAQKLRRQARVNPAPQG